MSHLELDRLVAGLAQKSGAKIIFNNNISSIPKGFDRIIGCDGANSFVRRNLKLPEPQFRLGIQTFQKKEDSSDFVETWPCEKGFMWRIPRGKEIEYGIIAKPENAKKFLSDFLKKKNSKFFNIFTV